MLSRVANSFKNRRFLDNHPVLEIRACICTHQASFCPIASGQLVSTTN